MKIKPEALERPAFDGTTNDMKQDIYKTVLEGRPEFHKILSREEEKSSQGSQEIYCFKNRRVKKDHESKTTPIRHKRHSASRIG